MKTAQVFNVTKSVLIVKEAYLALSLGQRLKGLLGRPGLLPDEAMILKPCTSIHTFFMHFPIDALFLDKEMRIIKIIRNMPPNRLSPIIWSSRMAIEFAAGKISQINAQTGDKIEIAG